jgi:hypothetical protein
VERKGHRVISDSIPVFSMARRTHIEIKNETSSTLYLGLLKLLIIGMFHSVVQWTFTNVSEERSSSGFSEDSIIAPK